MKYFLVAFMLVFLTVVLHESLVLAVVGDAERGRAIYLKHCALCHGSEGKGDGSMRFTPSVGDLTSLDIQQKSDFELWQTLHRGESNSAMKSWKWTLSEEEIVMVLAYVRSLAQ